MKRSEHIVYLSRDHHDGLLFCWKLRQGVKNGILVNRLQSYTAYFWEQHLQPHFEQEENILFAAVKDSLCEQAVEEHRQIRQLIYSVKKANAATSDQFSSLADHVDQHIRFEERVLFPYLEKIIPASVLADIGVRLQQLHDTGGPDNYTDEFWINKK